MVKNINSLAGPPASELRPGQSGQRADSSKASPDTSTTIDNAGHRREQVELSPQAQKLQDVARQLNDESAVNEDKVAAIKSAIEQGSYHIDNQRLADKMLQQDGLF